MTPTEAPAPVLVRPATPEDAEAVAGVHLASRAAAAMPPGAHPADEVRAWLVARLAVDEVWVAQAGGRVVGYLRMTQTWVDDLYVRPEHARQGIGSLLLDVAKALRPAGFSLWVFEMNGPARSFYLRHGLVEREHTDGRDNEETTPDLRMSWDPPG